MPSDGVKSAAPLPSSVPEKEDNLVYSLGHLAAFDISPIGPKDDLSATARNNIQLLVNRVFSLPQEPTDEGPAVKLPATSEGFHLPREKPIPKVTATTRWEKFALEKGITKRKRSRMVFDDASQDWKPRWGYKSAKSSLAKQDNWAMEVGPGDDPYENPFLKKRAEKKLIVAKQKAREIRNRVEATGRKMTTVSAPDLSSAKQGGRGKDGLQEALRRAQTSSRSFGKFDKEAPREKDLRSKRRKVAGFSSTKDEREHHLKMAGRVLGGDGPIDRTKAGKLGLQLEHAANAERKATGGGGHDRGKKGRRSKNGSQKSGGKRRRP
jgi:regulator of ribosome biosynthesis